MEGINESIGILDSIWEDSTPDEEVIETDSTDQDDNTEVDTEIDTEESEVEDSEEEELDYEEIDAPDFIPETYRKVPKFDDTAEELKWYKDSYKNVVKAYETDEFRNTILDKYKDALLEADANVGELKTIQKAFKDNPELMIKLYYPEYLVEKGIEPKFSESERLTIVDKGLQKEFGSDYKDKYNPSELANPTSLSSKMFRKQQEMLESIEQEEMKNVKAYQDAQPNPEKLQTRINEERQKYFSDLDDEQFGQFIKEVQEWKDYSLLDIHRMKYFDKYAEAIYKQGLDSGRKALAKELKTAGKSVQPERREPAKEKQDDFADYFTSRIPRY